IFRFGSFCRKAQFVSRISDMRIFDSVPFHDVSYCRAMAFGDVPRCVATLYGVCCKSYIGMIGGQFCRILSRSEIRQRFVADDPVQVEETVIAFQSSAVGVLMDVAWEGRFARRRSVVFPVMGKQDGVKVVYVDIKLAIKMMRDVNADFFDS